jgi:hypothetical protein
MLQIFPEIQNRPGLMGAVLIFDALDQVQTGEPHGGNVKPLARQINCLIPKFRTFLRYLQQQQGAFLTLARNTHLRP